MRVIATVSLDRQGRLVPLCRATSPDLIKAVAEAAMAEIRAAADAERGTNETFATLLQQEAARISEALGLLGLTPDV